MFWRVFVIMSRDKRVLYLPTILSFFAFIGCTLIFVFDVWFAPRFAGDENILTEYGYLTVVALDIDIINTWYCTGLICYRLCSVLRQKPASAGAFDDAEADTMAGNPYQRIIRVLIQSGMLYSLGEAAFLICVAAGNRDGRYIMNYLISRIMGIATALLIIQLKSRPLGSNLQQPTNGDPSSFSMPVFRNWVKDELTTDGACTKDLSADEYNIEQTIPYLAPYEGQSHKPSGSTVSRYNIT
ncbi:hypothetical protein FRB94_005069 [Tulasnella sp. JGI-2019a]|nr:hypothetical protein FRB93_006350 [Tulasnella sp. JGI-2019a]KAG9000953.1 hypothetical protein FRB94_005069 [Tulasnella sp. JGI-2019a]